MRFWFRLPVLTLVWGALAFGAPAFRYALILEDEPVLTRSGNLSTMAVEPARQTILQKQTALRTQLGQQNIPVMGATQSLLNAVFVQATPEQAQALSSLPGVKGVVKLGVRHLHLDKAAQVVNAPAAWSALGGIPNAGAGMRIGIIDTGIDQTHPAFNDPSLPSIGCRGDCSFTNNKVIVARSYVNPATLGGTVDPASSRPDDFTPRDRVGHGTAVAMVAAGMTNTGPNGETITGMAPKAYLGSYKVYGSDGISDFATDDAFIMAVEDAFNDKMDVVNLSSGAYQLTGPLDTGSACGNAAGVPCDALAIACENAVKQGMLMVVSAGNEADQGVYHTSTPTLATVNSPASAPDVIAVGASTNSHTFVSGIQVNGPNVPSSIQNIAAEFGNGPAPATPLTAPVKDVSSVGDPLGCSAFPTGSLTGGIAIITRGTCTFVTKVQNAQNAGAVGVIITLANASDTLISPDVTGTIIPTALIGQVDGQTLRAYALSTPQATVTIDFTFLTQQSTQSGRNDAVVLTWSGVD